MTCLTDAVLADLVVDPSRADPQSLSHAETCESCRGRMEALRNLEETMHSSEFRMPDPVGAQAFDRGTQIGRYTILERIGAGAMGEVYAAYDPQLDRRVALKLLRPDRLREGGDDARARLMREAQAMAKLSHPSVVTVHDVGMIGGEVFVAMEFVDGQNLREWVSETPRTAAEILSVYRRAGRGLAAAHEAGLVHRDFKPANVLLGRDGRVRVVDFGLARASTEGAVAEVKTGEHEIPDVQPASGSGSGSGSSKSWSNALTQVGAVVGTPGYMPPEQLRGEVLDPRVDQFAFCVSLFEALYGHRPFQGESLRELAQAMKRGAPDVPPLADRVPSEVYRAIRKGLSYDVAGRFENMGALLAALSPREVRRSRGQWAAAVVVAVLATAGAGVWTWQVLTRDPCAGAEQSLEQSWSRDARETLRSSLARIDAAYAAHAASGAVMAMDAWASAWKSARRESCEATRVRGASPESELALRTACLELQLEDARALLGVLSKADRQIAQNAVSAIKALPSPAACLSPEALARLERLPADPKIRAEVERLRARLGEVRALVDSGKYEHALTRADELERKVESTGSPSLLSELLLLRGGAEQRMDRFDDAEKSLQRAALSAFRGRNEEVAIAAWTLLADVVGSSKADFDGAMTWLKYAEAALERSPQPLLAAQLAHRTSVIHMRHQRYPEALAFAERALATHELAGAGEDPLLVDILENKGFTLSWLGRNDEAVVVYRRALEVAHRLYGPEHPELATVLDRFSTVLADMRLMEEAVARQKRAIAIRQAAFGPEGTPVGRSLGNLAWIYLENGRFEEALEAGVRAVRIMEAQHGKDSPFVGDVYESLGRAASGAGRPAEAIHYLQRAGEITQQAYGADSLRYAEVAHGIGVSLSQLRKHAEAIPMLEHALNVRVKRTEVALKVGQTRAALAKALGATGKNPRRARELIEQARADFRSAGEKGAAELIALDGAM